MFARLVISGIFAGALAGCVGGILQLYFVQPLLLSAELYESGQIVHFGAGGSTANIAPGIIWGGFNTTRDTLSILFSIAIYCGYGLLLVAAQGLAQGLTQGLTLAKTPASNNQTIMRQGAIWGLAGFCAFHFAPSIGLAPELPGNASAALETRQIWWFTTALATALALWLFAFGGRSWHIALGIALILAPHIIGAPHSHNFHGTAPPELAALFATRSLGVGCIAWLILGTTSHYFYHRLA